MLVREAIEHLEGHAIMSTETARQVCDALAVPFHEQLVMRWQTVQEATQQYGFVPVVAPGQGVDALDLSYHITETLGLGSPGYSFHGRGKQSHANQQAIRRAFSERGKL